MTAPNDEPSFLLRMILDKLDGIEKKIDGHSEKIVSHEIRLDHLEKAKDSAWKTKAAVGVAALSAALSWALPLIAK